MRRCKMDAFFFIWVQECCDAREDRDNDGKDNRGDANIGILFRGLK
jgi:hypothetical protein